MKTSAKQQLNRVFSHQWWIVGNNGIAEIYMIADGKGPMGFYDRIHVIPESDDPWVLPAHHCEQWEVSND